MITIVDYGAGNLRSVYNSFKHIGADIVVAENPNQLQNASKIVLPGVGAFGAGMDALRERGFIEPIRYAVESGKPLFGICLGMQYLFEQSNEMGDHAGLGLLKGDVVRFPNKGLVVPHIGWNQLQIQRHNPLLKGIDEGSYAYFVHSYYVRTFDDQDIVATTDYGLMYPSIVAHENIFGIQCHPEKSQAIGLKILKNFVEVSV